MKKHKPIFYGKGIVEMIEDEQNILKGFRKPTPSSVHEIIYRWCLDNDLDVHIAYIDLWNLSRKLATQIRRFSANTKAKAKGGTEKEKM